MNNLILGNCLEKEIPKCRLHRGIFKSYLYRKLKINSIKILDKYKKICYY